MPNSVQLVPNAAELAKSIRGLGYTPSTALADLIDNSIFAGSKSVRVTFDWNDGGPMLLILDDGVGMAQDVLLEAMRLGSDPDKPRAAEDLGRFGLGLKTASLSQARAFTIASRPINSETCIASWDLDHIEATGSWEVQLGIDPAIAGITQPLDVQPHGTLIVWRNLDLLLGGGKRTVDAFLQIAETVSDHLGMIFHRFIDSNQLEITINGSPVRAWNPLATGDPNCRHFPPIKIESTAGHGAATFIGCILPRPSSLNSQEDAVYAGPNGWTAQQGFYIYRGNRMVVSGGWLDLGRAGRPWRLDRDHALARISLDISNASDAIWALDVRKSMLVVPQDFKLQLQRAAQEIRRIAKSALTARRGTSGTSGRASEEPLPPVWLPERIGALIRFRIDRKHPLIAGAKKATRDAPGLIALLDQIDADLPLQPNLPAAAVQTASTIQLAQIADVIKLARNLYYSLRKAANLNAEEALARLVAIPQFREHETVLTVAIESYELELQKVSS